MLVTTKHSRRSRTVTHAACGPAPARARPASRRGRRARSRRCRRTSAPAPATAPATGQHVDDPVPTHLVDDDLVLVAQQVAADVGLGDPRDAGSCRSGRPPVRGRRGRSMSEVNSSCAPAPHGVTAELVKSASPWGSVNSQKPKNTTTTASTPLFMGPSCPCCWEGGTGTVYCYQSCPWVSRGAPRPRRAGRQRSAPLPPSGTCSPTGSGRPPRPEPRPRACSAPTSGGSRRARPAARSRRTPPSARRRREP